MAPKPFNPPQASTLYPTMSSLEEVEAHAIARLPITSTNEMLSILKLQQNTLINLLKTHAY